MTPAKLISALLDPRRMSYLRKSYRATPYGYVGPDQKKADSGTYDTGIPQIQTAKNAADFYK